MHSAARGSFVVAVLVLVLVGMAASVAGASRAPDARLFTIAGGGRGALVDGALASAVRIPGTVQHTAPLADGSVAFIDPHGDRIWRVDTQGRVRLVAGSGRRGFSGDGGPATAAAFQFTSDSTLTAHRDGLVVADTGNRRIRAISLRTRLVHTIAGSGRGGFAGDGGPALEAALEPASDLAADGGSVLVSAGVVRQVGRDGRITSVLGNEPCLYGDGSLAVGVPFHPYDMASLPDGSLLISSAFDQSDVFTRECLRRVDPSGIVRVLAGGGPIGGSAVPSASAAGGGVAGRPAEVATAPGEAGALVEFAPYAIWSLPPSGTFSPLVRCPALASSSACPAGPEDLDGQPVGAIGRYDSFALLPGGLPVLAYGRDLFRVDPDGVVRRFFQGSGLLSRPEADGEGGVLVFEACAAGPPATCAVVPPPGGSDGRILRVRANGTAEVVVGGGPEYLRSGVAAHSVHLAAGHQAVETPDRAVWFTAGSDLWRVEPGGAVTLVSTPAGGIYTLAALPDSTVVASGNRSQVLRIRPDGTSDVIAGGPDPSDGLVPEARVAAGGGVLYVSVERRIVRIGKDGRRTTRYFGSTPHVITALPSGDLLINLGHRLAIWPAVAQRPLPSTTYRSAGYFGTDDGATLADSAGDLGELHAGPTGAFSLAADRRLRVAQTPGASVPAVAITSASLAAALRHRLEIRTSAPGALAVEAWSHRVIRWHRTVRVRAGTTGVRLPPRLRGVAEIRARLRTTSGGRAATAHTLLVGDRLTVEAAARSGVTVAPRARRADDDGWTPPTTTTYHGCQRFGDHRLDCVSGYYQDDDPGIGGCTVESAYLAPDGVIWFASRAPAGYGNRPCPKRALRFATRRGFAWPRAAHRRVGSAL